MTGTRGGGARWLRRAVQLVATVGITWFIVARLGVTLDEAFALERAMPDLRPLLLAASIVVLLLAFLVAGGLWGRMVGELGGRRPSTGRSIRIVFTANLGRYLPGKIWQMAGLAALSARAGVAPGVGAAAGVLGQLLLLGGAALWGIPLLLGVAEARAAALIALGLLVPAVLLLSVPRTLRAVLSLAFRLSRVPPDPEVQAPGRWFGPRWLLVYTALWALYAAAFLLFVRGLGIPGGSLPGLGSAFAAAYLLGYVAVFAPAGIGIREGFLIAFLRPAVGDAAVGVAVLARVWMTLVELAPAGIFAIGEVFGKGARERVRAGDPAGKGGEG